MVQIGDWPVLIVVSLYVISSPCHITEESVCTSVAGSCLGEDIFSWTFEIYCRADRYDLHYENIRLC